MDELIAVLLQRSTIADAALRAHVEELVTVGEPELALVTILGADPDVPTAAELNQIEAHYAHPDEYAGRAVVTAVQKARGQRAADLVPAS